MRIGIDFGTYRSNAAFLKNGEPELIKQPYTMALSMPCTVYVTPDGAVLAGQGAENVYRDDPESGFRFPKRALWHDTAATLGARELSPREMAAAVFKALLFTSEAATGGRPDEAALVVPANAPAAFNASIVEAAHDAGFGHIELIAAPLAAASYLAYVSAPSEGDIVLVYSLGAGGFDAGLVRYRHGAYQLLGDPVGTEGGGGLDFERKIYFDLLEQCPGVVPLLGAERTDPVASRARVAVMDVCRALKERLSDVEAVGDLLLLPEVAPERYAITRSRFDDLIHPYVAASIVLCREMVARADVPLERVRGVMLAGGSTLIPYVRMLVERELGRPLIIIGEPDMVFSQGAVLTGAELRRPNVQSHAEHGATEFTVATTASPDGEPALWSTSGRLNVQELSARVLRAAEAVSLPPADSRDATGMSGAPEKTFAQPIQYSELDSQSWTVEPAAHVRDTDEQVVVSALTDNGVVLRAPQFVAPHKMRASSNLVFSGTGDTDPATAHRWNLTVDCDSYALLDVQAPIADPSVTLDGSFRAAASTRGDNAVDLWQEGDTKPPARLRGHTGEVTRVAFTTAGTILASAGKDAQVRLWALPDGLALGSFAGHAGAVPALTFSLDGRLLASGGEDRAVHVWELATGRRLAGPEGHTATVRLLAFSPDGRFLASAGDDCAILLWPLSEPGTPRRLDGHTEPVTSLAFSADSRLLASADSAGSVRLWRALKAST